MDFSDPKRKPRYLSKIIMAVLLTAMCVVMLTQPPCHRRPPSVVILFTLLPVYLDQVFWIVCPGRPIINFPKCCFTKLEFNCSYFY